MKNGYKEICRGCQYLEDYGITKTCTSDFCEKWFETIMEELRADEIER